MTKLFALSLIALSATLIGCASAPEVQESRSGFMSSYDRLQPDEDEEGVLRYMAEGFSPTEYANVEIAPTQILISDTLQKDSSLTLDEQRQLGEYFANKLQQEFGGGVELGETGGTLKIRTAFTGITNASEDLSAWQYLPITAIATGIGEATGTRDKVAVMFLEFEGIDTESGEVVVQTMRRLEMDDLDPKDIDKLGIEAVKPKVDEAIQLLKENLDKHVR